MNYKTQVINLDDIVAEEHQYRKFLKVWDLTEIASEFTIMEAGSDHKGYGLFRLFKCLLLQFMENLSDRELEKFLKENTAGKWFCGFDIVDMTPEHSVFYNTRKRIGTKRLSDIFNKLKTQLQSQGLMSETFTFVDATHLIAKANLWEEKDKAIKLKIDKLNNETLPQVAYDKQAKIGCKGNTKYWYGYKQHTSVDMQSGLINKIAITPANLTDAQGFKHVAPNTGAVYADKGYCKKTCQLVAKIKGIHLAAIKNNNMIGKNKDLDRWYSAIRAPYERVFSKQNKRVRYVGIAKNQFSAFMNAICFNLKRLLVISPPDLQHL
jgi:IS5 family transposase